MKNRAKELIIEHKLERGGDLDKTILRKTSQECSVSTRLLTKMIDMVIKENVNEQEESKGAKKLDDMFDSEPVEDWGAPVSSSPSVGSSGDVLMKPPSSIGLEKSIKTEKNTQENIMENRAKTMSESSDYSADVSDSIFNQMKKPESEFGKITPVQKRPKKDDQNSNVEFGSLAADLFKPDNATRKLNLSDSDSSESDSDSASSESDDEGTVEKVSGTEKVMATQEPPNSTNSVDVDQSEGLQNGDEGKQSNDEAAGAIVKDQETSSPGQELETKENVESVQNEASIHSQLEMSDESESELCIDAGDSQTSPKKSVMSSKKASKELNENLDLNDYWMKELKKDKNWKNQDSFEVLITDITNKRSKPAFARVVALGRIELGLHDDVSKIVSSDMLKFILKCHEENQFSAMETKIQQLIKGMDFNYLFLIVMKSAEVAVYRIYN